MKLLLSNIKFLLLILLIVLLIFYFHPYIMDMKKNLSLEKGTILSPYINLIFSLILFLSFDYKNIIRCKEIKSFTILLLLFTLLLIITNAFGFDIDIFNDIRQLLIPLFAIIIGWQLKINDKKYFEILVLFIVCSLIVALSQVFTNIGGFVIEEQYLVENKNALGVILATALILSFIFYFANQNSKYILFLVISLILLICLLTIRARTATLISLLFMLFILFKKFSGRNIIFGFIGVLSIIFLIYFILPIEAQHFLYDSFFLNQEQNVTSDRMDRNLGAINFLKDNLFLGNLANKSVSSDIVHNYPLLKLYNYGLFLGLVILSIYLYLLVVLVRNIFNTNFFDIRNIGYIILLIPFGISMAEPAFPYGPGTATVFNFMLFGISLRYKYDMKINNMNV